MLRLPTYLLFITQFIYRCILWKKYTIYAGVEMANQIETTTKLPNLYQNNGFKWHLSIMINCWVSNFDILPSSTVMFEGIYWVDSLSGRHTEMAFKNIHPGIVIEISKKKWTSCLISVTPRNQSKDRIISSIKKL